MAEPVKVRRLTDEEGRKLQRLVRRGEGKGKASVVRYRRALVVLASAGGNTVPVPIGDPRRVLCGGDERPGARVEPRESQLQRFVPERC